jgi:excisionase family DNA binding protein
MNDDDPSGTDAPAPGLAPGADLPPSRGVDEQTAIEMGVIIATHLAAMAADATGRAEVAERRVGILVDRLGDQPRAASASDADELISVREAAEIIGVDRNTLYALLKAGEGPPARNVGTLQRPSYRLHREAVLAWRRGGDVPPQKKKKGAK